MSYGIRVANSLSKPVRVEVIDGKTIIREAIIQPNRNKYIPLEKPGNYDVRTAILEPDGNGSYDELGPAAWKVIDHQDVAAPVMRPVLTPRTVVLEAPHEQKTARYWRNIITWVVSPGCMGELLAVEVEQHPDVLWRLKVTKPGDGRFGGSTTEIKATTTFSGNRVTGGEIIKLQAKSLSPTPVTVSARISGQETIVDESLWPAEARFPASETEPADEEEEEPVRSLADMFKEMEKREVEV